MISCIRKAKLNRRHERLHTDRSRNKKIFRCREREKMKQEKFPLFSSIFCIPFRIVDFSLCLLHYCFCCCCYCFFLYHPLVYWRRSAMHFHSHLLSTAKKKEREKEKKKREEKGKREYPTRRTVFRSPFHLVFVVGMRKFLGRRRQHWLKGCKGLLHTPPIHLRRCILLFFVALFFLYAKRRSGSTPHF